MGGADLGARVLGSSHGNETGHWEDAFAVDLHEELLGRFGVAWSDPFGLPDDWAATEAAGEARSRIARYLRDDRSRHGLWALKDPRLCLFADLWRDAAAHEGIATVAVLVLRSPDEIAASLHQRDGLGMRHAELLWLDYMQSAARALERMPHVVVGYEQLLRDWEGAISAIRVLPGVGPLDYDDVGRRKVQEFLDPARRHHHSDSTRESGRVVANAWRMLSASLESGRLTADIVEGLAQQAKDLREIVGPMLDESRLHTRRLWERTARAEAQLAQAATESVGLAPRLGELQDLIQSQHADVITLYSRDIRHMQEVSAQALAGAEAAQRALVDAKAEALAPVRDRMDAIESKLVSIYSDDIQRMQQITAQAQMQAASMQQALDDAKATGVLAQRGLEEARARIASMQGELDEANAQAAASRRERDEANAQAAAIRRELDETNTRIGFTQREVDGLKEQAAADAALRDEDAAKMEALSCAVRESDARHAALSEQFDQQRRERTALTSEVESLRLQAQLLDEIRASRSWTMTRPLRVLRRALSGRWSAADSAEWRAWLRRLAARAPLLPASARSSMVAATLPQTAVRPEALPDASTAPILRLAPQTAGLPDIFVWAVIDWHFRTQRPQHLARALAAKGHRVFYISNNFVDADAPGFRIDPLDGDGRLFQLHLNLTGAPGIYFGMPDRAQVEAMRASLARVLEWSCTTASISLVQHPYWTPLIRAVPNARVVYDCMDHHAGFSENATAILQAEAGLVADSDLVIVTSGWLQDEIQPRARATALVRNAGEFEFFRHAPADVFRDPRGRRVIGYYGAIAEWFDPELVRAVATAHPDALVVLVGSDTSRTGEALADLPNVRMIGEVPYAELPYWLHGFDVCLLPFKVIPLTMATNPVKVYEYLAAGKPVVSVDLPEMGQFGALVRTARNREGFVSAVDDALAERDDDIIVRRKAFAAGQTWAHRAEALDQAIGAIREPKVSIVVLTYNNLAFTQACLFSIEAYSDYANLEVIVVDNASSDGSPEWLRAWERETSSAGHARRLILNDRNAGFSAGNNIGLHAATGDYLVVLNNDTYVTPGWVRTLCAHFRRDPALGLAGPVTNNIGNEARIDIAYDDMTEMIARAAEYTRAHPGESLAMRNAAFFCAVMPRATYERVGGLDEAFGIGFFEDDDYCRRVEQAGYRIACAEDVFVHHHLSASFDQLKAASKQALFERNKAIYEAKWGTWQPHRYRGA